MRAALFWSFSNWSARIFEQSPNSLFSLGSISLAIKLSSANIPGIECCRQLENRWRKLRTVLKDLNWSTRNTVSYIFLIRQDTIKIALLASVFEVWLKTSLEICLGNHSSLVLRKRVVWSTVSKAFLRSIKMLLVNRPSSMFPSHRILCSQAIENLEN